MIDYEPGKWSVSFAFTLHGSVFPKATTFALPCALSAIVLHFVFDNVDTQYKTTFAAGKNEANLLGGFTFILGFLVVFRSQKAYERWWEGGTLLQQLRGEWFNSYSSLLAFCNHSDEKEEEVQKLQHQLARLYSLLYGCALHQVATLDEKYFELLTLDGFCPKSIRFLQGSAETQPHGLKDDKCEVDKCEVVIQWIQRLVVDKSHANVIQIAPPILSRVFNQLGNGIVNLNNARKIKEFPIPFPLAQMITLMLLFHAVITPIICAATMNSPIWAGIITYVVTMSYWSINYIAVELEMPFGGDANDLPIHYMQDEFNVSLKTLLNPLAQKVPKYSFKIEQHAQLITQIIDLDGDLLVARSDSLPNKGREDVNLNWDTRRETIQKQASNKFKENLAEEVKAPRRSYNAPAKSLQAEGIKSGARTGGKCAQESEKAALPEGGGRGAQESEKAALLQVRKQALADSLEEPPALPIGRLPESPTEPIGRQVERLKESPSRPIERAGGDKSYNESCTARNKTKTALKASTGNDGDPLSFVVDEIDWRLAN